MYFKPTVIFIVVIAGLTAVYDTWAVSQNYSWTISATLLQVARDWPVVPFLMGLLAGHLFFPNRAAKAPGDKS